ncbi:putative FBD-associated F-box protein At5g56560 [Euphorbia lathyris]|uniref:putative FBD-associated F-box protein At5g56560 n=1 Tax=Euphorbia lathyris TaxID=212925 RepID=UPI0033133EC5
MARKMAKKEDRISDLPDCIIQYILSLLPSTKQVIQTGILSKHWKYQWTHVPVLIFDSTEFLNLPTSLCATFDFYSYVDDDSSIKSLTKDILHQLQHVNELKVGWYFTKSLTVLEAGDLFYPVLNIKCLTLRSPNLVKHMPGIACVLRSSPLLEKLVIEVPLNDQRYDYFPKANTFEESYWNLNAIVFNCLVYHLKTIKIIGFPKKDDIRKLLLNLVQFLLKNARLLEKMMVELKGRGTAFPLKVSKELLSLPRCSHHAIIEFITS